MDKTKYCLDLFILKIFPALISYGILSALWGLIIILSVSGGVLINTSSDFVLHFKRFFLGHVVAGTYLACLSPITFCWVYWRKDLTENMAKFLGISLTFVFGVSLFNLLLAIFSVLYITPFLNFSPLVAIPVFIFSAIITHFVAYLLLKKDMLCTPIKKTGLYFYEKLQNLSSLIHKLIKGEENLSNIEQDNQTEIIPLQDLQNTSRELEENMQEEQYQAQIQQEIIPYRIG